MTSRAPALTTPDYWDGIYARATAGAGRWTPRGYADRALAHLLTRIVRRARPRSILEVGCGDSRWLPYLSRLSGAMVAGVDSSPTGCALARARLAAEGVPGTIHQLDVIGAESAGIGRFDLVCSFGVVEHFSDLGRIMPGIARLVAPGGMLVTTVPNLKSIHGGLMAWWQPRIFMAHRIVTAAMLTSAYARLGFTGVDCRPLGICSLDIVSWDVEPRWPRLAKAVAPLMRRAIGLSDRLFVASRVYRGTPRLAPFLTASGIGPG